MQSGICILEFDRQRTWHYAVLYPVDQRLERGCGLTTNATRTVREAGNFKVAEEVINPCGRNVDAVIIVCGAFCRDETVRLVLSAT